MIGKLLCKLGRHRWVEEFWLYDDDNDRWKVTALACKRCRKVKTK